MKRNIKKLTALFLAVLMVMSTVPMLVSADDTEPEGYWKTLSLVQMDGFTVDASNSAVYNTTIGGKTYTASKLYGTNGKISGSTTKINFTDTWYWPCRETQMIEDKPATVGDAVLVVHGACHQENGWKWTSSDTGWKISNLWDASTVKAGDKIKITADIYVPSKKYSKKDATTEDIAVGTVTYNSASNKLVYEPTTLTEDAIPEKIDMYMEPGAQTAQGYSVNFEEWQTMTYEYELTEADVASGSVAIRGLTPSNGSYYAMYWAIGAVKVEKFEEKKAVGDGGYVKAITLPIDSFTTLKTNNSETEQSETINVNGRDIELKITGGTNWRRNGNSLVYRVDETVTWIPFIVEASKTKPANVGGYGLLHYGAWVNNRSTSSDSGWTITNLYNSSDVDPGDRVKITAQVYAPKADMTYMYYRDSNFKYGTRTYEYDSEGNKVASGGTHDVKGNPKPTSGPMRIIAGGAEHFTTVEGDKWCELTAEFDITDANINNNTITIDSGAVSSTQDTDTFYAMRHLIGSVKVEISKSANGSYTLDNGKEWQNISTVSMSDFTKIAPADTSAGRPNITTDFYATAPKDDGYIYASMNSGEYTGKTGYEIMDTLQGKKRLHFATGFRDVSDTYTWPADFPGAAGTKVLELDRDITNNWTLWSSGYGLATWVGAGYGAPDSYITLSNIFDESAVEVGDKLKITAWLMGRNISDVLSTATDGNSKITAAEETTAPVQMWISESDVCDAGDDATADASLVKYNVAYPDASKPEEYVSGEVTEDAWVKLSLEYTITEENKSISSIQINNDNLTNNVTHFPLQLVLAGVTVEKAVEKADQTNKGTITGKVALGLDYEIEGGVKVLVAAYKDNMFLGCDIIDYDYAGEYDFEIRDTLVGDDVSGADRVVAYIWDMNEYQPQILPIQLVKAE